jgi:hypothetical protein
MKNLSLRIFITFSVLFAFFTAKAQTADAEKLPELSRFNAKFTVAIPTLLSNKALRTSFRGVYDAGLNLQTRVVKGMYVGAHGNFTGFKIAVDKFNALGTECQTLTAGLNIGYEKFSTPRVMWFVNLAGGYNWIEFNRVKCADSIRPILNHTAFNIRPSAGFNYYSDDNFSIGMIVSYTMLNYQFDPKSICLNEYGTFKANESNGNLSYFSVGVIINFNLRKDLFLNPNESEGEEEN